LRQAKKSMVSNKAGVRVGILRALSVARRAGSHQWPAPDSSLASVRSNCFVIEAGTPNTASLFSG
jgi:hypothetical protein